MHAASFIKRVVNIPRSLCLVVGGVMLGVLYLKGVMTVNRRLKSQVYTKNADIGFFHLKRLLVSVIGILDVGK